MASLLLSPEPLVMPPEFALPGFLAGHLMLTNISARLNPSTFLACAVDG